MPSDNAAPIAAGADVSFPRNGVTSGTIARLSDSSFTFGATGVYQVTFEVPVTEAGQLVLTLNGAELPYTVVGRNAENTQIVGMAIVSSNVATSVLTLRNPASATAPITVTPSAGGELPVSAHLVILRLA